MTHAADTHESTGVPIACSLSSGEVETRLQEWRELLSGVSERRHIEGGIRLTFARSAVGAAIADLAAREHACCPFLTFTLGLDDDAPTLEVRADAAAQEIVNALFGGT